MRADVAGAAFDVVFAGAVNVDTVAVVDHIPLDDEREVSEPFITAGGGPAATAAVAAARLGARVAFCGVVGDDAEGRVARTMLEQEGVDTRWLRVDRDASTARALVLVSRSTSGRSIVTTIAPPPRPGDIPFDASPWLHLDQTGYRSAIRAGRRRAGGAMISLDGGNPIPGLVLRGIELYAPTLPALLAHTGSGSPAEGVAAARAAGARKVVVTAGSAGSYVSTDDSAVHVAAFPIEVVSTLGAGDVFHGALLARLVAGDSLLDAVRSANAAAALSCRAVDGRSAIPTMQQLEAFLHREAA